MGDGLSYQVFETYYARAREADLKKQYGQAKKLYFLASSTLLKIAKESDGETKKALLERAVKLQRMAELLPDENEETNTISDKYSPLNNLSNAEKDCKNKKKDSFGRDEDSRDEEDSGNARWKSVEKPDISFDDIAGLQDVKDSIFKRVILPRKYPEVYETFQMKPNGGILLYGPPGTGKTMMAKAIAHEVDAAFYSIRCSDIVSKYFGEAEKNVKSLFKAARRESAAVIFFDEFEAIAAHRGGDTPVMNRLVPELLSQMDGFSGNSGGNLLFLAATNRPWDIDSAFLRPPRLTEKIYVGLPDYEARSFLIYKVLHDVPLEDNVCLDFLCSRTDGYNAADLVELCMAVKQFAVDRTIKEKRISRIRQTDLEKALNKVKSSVRQEDIKRIADWEKE